MGGKHILQLKSAENGLLRTNNLSFFKNLAFIINIQIDLNVLFTSIEKYYLLTVNKNF